MSKDFGPSVIASSFIKQYYEMMAKHPENLHMFYNEDSFFMHSDLTHQGVSASSPEPIRAAISSLNLRNCKVDLSNGYIDAQKSVNNGVLVVVVGQLTSPSGVTKPFVQSFLLSCQGSTAYYVSNSLFRLLVPSEEQEDPESVLVNLAPPVKHDAAYTQPSAPSVSASSGTTAWMETPAAPHVHAQPAAAHPVVHQQPHLHEESAAASAHALNAAAVEALLEDDVEVDVPAPVPAAPVVAAPVVAAPPAVPTDPFKKLNYSDIVKKAQGGAAAATAPTAATPVSAPRAAPAQPAAAAPVQTTSSASFTAGFSVYVKQVPEAASEADLRAVFAPFGTVTAVDVQVGRSFAFVKFDSHAAVVAAVTSASANPLVVHGATLRVEERNSSRGGGSSSGATAGGASGSGNHGGRDGAGRSRGERGGRDGRDGRDGQRDGRDRQQGGGGGGGDRNRGGDRDRDGSRQGASKGSSGGRSGSSGNTKAN